MRTLRTVVLATLFVMTAGAATAMPQFARKYHVECNYCHTIVPRLTQAGFEFRSAGWRTPEEIGKKEKDILEWGKFGDYNSLRLQARYDYSKTDNAGVTSTTNQLTHFEITWYPLSGSFFGNYSSLFEISLAPGDSPEVENGYVRGNWKLGTGYCSARLGVFHPFEGYGASDRPLTIGRPLFQTTGAKFNQPTFFTPWTSPTTGGSFDQVGLELGYTVNRTAVRATLFNGLSFSEEEGTLVPATSLKGSDSKVKGRPSYNSKDFQLFLTQILTDNGGGVSLYYYNGRVDLPVNGAPETFFQNGFNRFAAYASYPIGPALLLGGYLTGQDDTFTSATGYGPRNTVNGFFAEADVIPGNHWGAAFRYDQVDPSTKVDNNKVTAYTVAVNGAMNNGLQAIAQFQHKTTQQITKANRTDDAFQIRFIWIW